MAVRKQEELKKVIEALKQGSSRTEARQLLDSTISSNRHNPELLAGIADLLLKAGEVGEAESLLEWGLKENPDSYHLLVNLGCLDEKRGQVISAYDLIQRAEFLAETGKQKKNVHYLLARVKSKIKSGYEYKEQAYRFRLKGNGKPITLDYDLNQLARRKVLFDVILSKIDPGAKTVYEIECDVGIIAKNLTDHGFKVEATSSEMSDIVLSMGFEYGEMLRKLGRPSPLYNQLDINLDTAASTIKKDVIMVMPALSRWYTDRDAGELIVLLKQLIARAKKQFFFYFPPQIATGSDKGLGDHILYALQGSGIKNTDPRLCSDNEGVGKLYCIELTHAEGKGNLSRVLPKGLKAAGSRSDIFEVEVEKCRSLNGFGFNANGWNHFNALLEQLSENQDLEYDKCILKTFYERFQPTNRQEHFFGLNSVDMPPLNKGWTIFPWMESTNRVLNPVKSPVSRPGGNHHYGPNSDDFGKREQRKLLQTKLLVERFGYLPEIFPDGYVLGYFLKDKDDYRFMVCEGQHRMAAVGALGCEEIKAKFAPDNIPVVDIAKIKQWPQVKQELYSLAVAEKVFYYFFEEDGRRKAKQLGLI